MKYPIYGVNERKRLRSEAASGDTWDIFALLEKLGVIENVPSRLEYLFNRFKEVPLYEA